MENYKDFKLLSDEAQNLDMYEGKIHEHIAEAIYKLIDNPNNLGITLGLEGEWGSGKSTIVSILKSKLNSTIYHYFYFDAWAHEGDPLRRVFLEQLILQTDKSGELTDIKELISKRKKKTQIKSSKTATLLGKILAISAFFVPLGASILSTYDYTNVTFDNTGEILWLLILGIISCIAPLIVILLNYVFFGSPKKNPEKWDFLEGESTENITNEISEDEEKSSIEFEHFFQIVIDKIIKSEKERLIIVLDNLDRIDSKDSLKIWSTLQTFLQQKNPIDTDINEKYKKTWILVPYDQEGLSKLWEKDGINCSKSFFEKCFQLRFFVPKPVRTNWQSFTEKLIDESIPNWSKLDKQNITNVLINTRNSLADIPTPRQIKTYINQVIVLRQYADVEISISSICYFVILKFINNSGMTTKKIEDELLKKTIPYINHNDFLDENITMQLSGLIYGTNPILGQQLLLEPQIERALKARHSGLLEKLVEEHNEGFWSVLQFHIYNLNKKEIYLDYASNIYNILFLKHREKIDYLLDKMKDLDVVFPDNKNLNNTISLLKLLLFYKENSNSLWESLMLQFNELMSKPDAIIAQLSKIYIELNNCFKKYNPDFVSLNKIPLQNWITWSNELKQNDISGLDFVVPSNNILDEVSKRITPGAQIPNEILDIIDLCVASQLTEWNSIIDSIKNHINWNNGQINGNRHSDRVFYILAMLILKIDDPNVIIKIKDLTIQGSFYNLAFHMQNSNKEILLYIAIILAIIYDEKFDSLQIPAVQNSNQGYDLVKNIWKSNDANNSRFIWDLLVKYSKEEVLWKIANNNTNKLISSMLDIAKNEKLDFLIGDNILYRFLTISDYIQSEDFFDYADIFLQNTKIIDYILNIDTFSILDHDFEVYSLLKSVENEDFQSFISDRLISVSEDYWFKSLTENYYLLDILICIKNRNDSFILKNDYCNSLQRFIFGWAKKEIKPQDWIISNWEELLSVLNAHFKKYIIEKVTDFIWNNLQIIEYSFLKVMLPLFNIKSTIPKHNIELQKYFDEEIIQKDDSDKCKVLELILENDIQNKLIIEDYFKEVVAEPLKSKIDTITDSQQKQLLINLAERLAIDIQSIENDDPA